MPSEYIDIQGKISWLHAIALNKYEKYSVTIHPDQKSLEIIRDLQAKGVKNVMKKDNDNQYYIQFSRDPTKFIKGKVIAFGPPKVIGKDGLPVDVARIGNGSDATVRLEVYKHPTPNGGSATAAKFDSIRIDNLVPFDNAKDIATEEERKRVESLAASPPPVWD